MTNSSRFFRARHLLYVEDNRVQRGALSWRDFETITQLCFAVDAINRSGDTPAQPEGAVSEAVGVAAFQLRCSSSVRAWSIWS
jgi:hypothetical protein